MRWVYVLTGALSLMLALGLYQGAFSYFKAQEIDRATARLTLYRNTLQAELRRFAHMPYILSQDPVVVETLAGADPTDLDARLKRFAARAGIDAIYLMDATGHTISASNAGETPSFKGQNYGFRPYFQQAQAGGLGEFYGIGATTGEPGYFYAIAVNDGSAAGVIAIKVDLSALQNTWTASGERIVLSDAQGVVLLASDPEWRYTTLRPLTADQRAAILATRQFAQEPLDPMDWAVDRLAQTARLAAQDYLYLQAGDLPNDWSLHFFVPDDGVVARSSLVSGGFLLVVLISLITWQSARARRVDRALRRSEYEEAQLREANERLAAEIAVRRAAEQDLQKTQAELERAGRLAALGTLASSVTHELGQPIAAMRNQLVAAEMTTGASALTEKMQALVARMEAITRQLKFFSRKGRDKFERVDMADVIEAALDLLAPTIEQTGAHLVYQRPAHPHTVVGNQMRLEQVATNLVRNALDAVEGRDTRVIDITIDDPGDQIAITVADTGHGLGDQSFDDLREPFATTRESGRGMGLGLTISAGIVSDHAGTIEAENRPRGGAVFRITLPQAKDDS